MPRVLSPRYSASVPPVAGFAVATGKTAHVAHGALARQIYLPVGPPLALANEWVASHIDWMAQAFRARLLEVTVTAQEPTIWKWDISEHGLEVMYGYETSRESAQIEGDTALFKMLSEGQP